MSFPAWAGIEGWVDGANDYEDFPNPGLEVRGYSIVPS